jgi:putative transposase
LTEANGIPVGLAVAGANVNDFKLVGETVESVPIARPKPTRRKRQNLCLDKGYDYQEPRDLVCAFKFTAHIRSRVKRQTSSSATPASVHDAGLWNELIAG